MVLRLVFLALPLLLTTRGDAAAIALPGCQAQCGGRSVPYPFGIGDSCSRGFYFNITCDWTDETPPRPYARPSFGQAEVFDVSLLSGQARISGYLSSDCYDRNGKRNNTLGGIDLIGSPYTFSETRNRFVALGCDTAALITGDRGVSYTGGCISYCNSSADVAVDGTCSGVGCCETPIPRGLRSFYTTTSSFDNHSKCWDFNPCGYAFMVEVNRYQFRVEHLLNDSFYSRPRLPVVVDWSIGNQTCEQVQRSPNEEYACRSNNSRCVDSPNGFGYLCNCTEGYEGNPYLVDGCQEIDECSRPRAEYPCSGICKNTPGSYSCTCPEGTAAADDDPKKNPCKQIPKEAKQGLPLHTKLALGIGIGLFLIVLASCCAWWGLQKRKYIQVRQTFFERNGGVFLRLQLSAWPSCTFRIYTEEELEKATKNFDDRQIIGRGGHGVVYKGEVEDKDVPVAIKRSSMVSERQNKEFAKEISVLSQVNHRNVVKLLGCCLEVEIPMLVYEFIPGGTLFDFIHDPKHGTPISLDTRLRIAAEAAEALAYLHSYASPPILHGDIKSSNILLDGKLEAKVSDFGASILAPSDTEQLTTVVQGTWGYLDPEYLQTCLLTEKSDVYSFGVVLAELLTRKKPLRFGGCGEDTALASNFVCAVKRNRLIEILDAELVQDGEMDRLCEVAKIIMQCLRVKGEDRPTMKEVAKALQMLGNFEKLPIREESERLLGASATYAYGSGEVIITHGTSDIEGGR